MQGDGADNRSTVRPKLADKLCRICNKPIVGRRSSAKYCSDECRFEANRRDTRTRQRLKPEYTHCLYCFKELPEKRRSNQKFCKEFCQKRYHQYER